MRRAFRLLLPLVSACTVGTPAHKYRPAIDPRGAAAELWLANDTALFGELLAVTDTALVIRQSEASRITVIRFSALASGRFNQVGSTRFDPMPSAVFLERLRRASRFPQGLSPDLVRRLLEAHAQTEPVVY